MSGAQWVGWARRIASLAQNGLTYTEGAFDRQRYEELRGIAAEMLAAGAGVSAEEMRGALALEEGYATPKVDVRGVVFREGRILLVREVEDGLWTLPGGWADAGESPREAVEKEIAEESGFITRATKLLAVHERDRRAPTPLPWAVYKLFIRCEIRGGEARGSIETSEIGFFDELELPRLSEGRVTHSQVRRMFDHLRDPLLPTDLD